MILPRSLAVVISTLVLGCALRGQQTIHQLDVIPNAAATVIGEICFVETTGWGSGAVQKVCLDAPASIATTFTLTLPDALPGSPSCLEFDTSGNSTYVTCGGGGSSPPFVDTTSIVEGSADATKELRFEVDTNVPTATVVVATSPASNFTMAGLELTQTFTADQTFAANILESGTRSIGTTGNPWTIGYATAWRTEELNVAVPASSFGTFWKILSPTSSDFDIQDTGLALRLSINSAPTEDFLVFAENVLFQADTGDSLAVELQAGNNAADDVTLEFEPGDELDGYRFRWDQSLDEFLLETHTGTDLLVIDANLATSNLSWVFGSTSQTSSTNVLETHAGNVLFARTGSSDTVLELEAGDTTSSDVILRFDSYSLGEDFQFLKTALGAFVLETVGGTDIFVAGTSEFELFSRLVNDSSTHAGLPSAGNGTQLYCSNCTKGSDPCTSGGNGAMAFRVNGSWQCL